MILHSQSSTFSLKTSFLSTVDKVLGLLIEEMIMQRVGDADDNVSDGLVTNLHRLLVSCLTKCQELIT